MGRSLSVVEVPGHYPSGTVEIVAVNGQEVTAGWTMVDGVRHAGILVPEDGTETVTLTVRINRPDELKTWPLILDFVYDDDHTALEPGWYDERLANWYKRRDRLVRDLLREDR